MPRAPCYCGVVFDLSERESLVCDLGENNALIVRNHGLFTVGRTISEAFNAMHRLELSCKAQLAAMACNTALHSVPEDVLKETDMNDQPQTRRPYGVMEWPSLPRKLNRIDPWHRQPLLHQPAWATAMRKQPHVDEVVEASRPVRRR